MKTKKKTLAKIMSSIIALVLSSFLAFTAFGASIGYSSSWGNYTTAPITKSISPLRKDTGLINLTKCFPDKTYGCFQLNKGSTVNSMNVWIENIDGKQVSEKYYFEPGNKYQFINYYRDITFVKGGQVCFVGDQGNIKSKNAVFEAWGY